MTYREYRENRQAEFNALPIFFAFSNEQFEKALNERGITLDEAPDKIYKYGYGGFYLKSDADVIKEYHKRVAQELNFLQTVLNIDELPYSENIEWDNPANRW